MKRVSKEELQELKRMVESGLTLKEMSEATGRGVSAIGSLLSRHDMSHAYVKPWTGKDEQWLLQNYKACGSVYCAKRLNRTVGATRRRYQALVKGQSAVSA